MQSADGVVMLSVMRITDPNHHVGNSIPIMTSPHHVPPIDARAPQPARPEPHGPRPRTPNSRAAGAGALDLVVMGGAVLVAVAAGMALSTQLGTGWEIATAAGLAVFGVAATLHVVLQRTEEIARLKSQVGAMERELTGLRGAGPHQPGPGETGRMPSRQTERQPLRPHDQIDERAEQGWAQPGDTGSALDARGLQTSERPSHGRQSRGAGSIDHARAAPLLLPEPVQEPATPTVFVTDSSKNRPAPASDGRGPIPPPARQRVERVVAGTTDGAGVAQPPANGSTAESSARPQPPVHRQPVSQESRSAPVTSEPHAPATKEPTSRTPASNPVDSLIETIANGLAAERQGLTTEQLLALPAPYPDTVISGDDASAEPLTPEASALAASVRAAIEAGRVEVHLQPILALDGLTTVSYEAFTRLRDAAGVLLKPSDYAAFAHRAGLNAGIEKLALLRAIHVLQQLDMRAKLSPIFINVSRELLSDGKFFAEFVGAMKGSRNLSTYLVLEFAQPVAAAFDERDLESLDTLARLGFTFALDDVDHVEMDFESLLSRGLAFVKVSADVFRHGLIAGEAVIPTPEIRLLFEDAGLQLIVHHISDEAGLDAALAETVTFGQGNLFAKPKPVRADLLGEASRAA